MLLLTATSAVAQSDPNAVFATVNGDEIKSGEFWHRLAWYRIDVNSPLAPLPAGFLAVNQLITERLIYQMARDKGVSPTDPEIEADLKAREDANPTLLTELKSQGRPESDLYEQVKYELAQYKLRTFGITITDQEVEKHYQTYPTEFTEPKKYKLRVIVVDTDEAQNVVDQELGAGKSFGDVAKAHSMDLSKGVGGAFGTVPATQLGAPAAQALGSIKIGQTTGWITGAQGSTVRVKYLLEDVVPSALQPLDPALRNKIRRKLSLDKGDIKNTVFADLDKVTLTAKVTINQVGFQRIYDEMIASYRKAHPSG